MLPVPDPYVWLVWSGAFVAAWAALYGACPRLRTVLWQVSLCTVPFALTEPLFVGRYWNPPTVLDLTGGRAHCDIESFLFCFGIGGVAAVLYNVVWRTPVRVPPKTPAQGRRAQAYVFAFLFPFLVYLPLQGFLDRPLWTGVALMAAGALVRALLFPTLRAKTLAGGLLFLGYYAAFLALLAWMAPGYIGRVWLRDIPGGRVLGVPWAEPAFALTMGMFWSGGYEQAVWLFAPPGHHLYGSQSFQRHAGPLPAPREVGRAWLERAGPFVAFRPPLCRARHRPRPPARAVPHGATAPPAFTVPPELHGRPFAIARRRGACLKWIGTFIRFHGGPHHVLLP